MKVYVLSRGVSAGKSTPSKEMSLSREPEEYMVSGAYSRLSECF